MFRYYSFVMELFSLQDPKFCSIPPNKIKLFVLILYIPCVFPIPLSPNFSHFNQFI